jgi:hypothetical protein
VQLSPSRRPLLHLQIVAGLALVAAVVAHPRLAAAQDADACIASNESAIKLRKDGHLIDSRTELAMCAASACPDPIRSSCQQRLADVDRAVPRIVFQVKDGEGNDVPAVKLTIDGQPREERPGAAIALDPGQHVFAFEGPGMPLVQKTLVLVEGVRDRSETVVLGRVAPATGTAATVEAVPSTAGGAQKILALVAGGVGIAGLAVGTVFGLTASSSWNAAQRDQSSSEQQSAASAATVSTVAFVTGGVAIAAGAVLWFTAPSGSGASSRASLGLAPCASAGGGIVVLRGGF